MPSPYTSAAQRAADQADSIADFAEFTAGTATKVTSQTTLVITHGLSGQPTFVVLTPGLKANAAGTAVYTLNTTSVTITRTTATSSWSVNYHMGYSATVA